MTASMQERVKGVYQSHFGAAYDDCTSIKMHRPLFAAQSALEFQRVRAFGTGEPCLLCRLLALPGPWNINYGMSVFILLHATLKQHRPIVWFL